MNTKKIYIISTLVILLFTLFNTGQATTMINTKNAPTPIGPYSQAKFAGPLLFLSGQIAIDPSTNKLVTDNITKETHQVMQNLQSVLKAADMDFDNVVKTTIYLTDMNNFSEVNKTYGEYFKKTKAFPARATVEISRLPAGARVEIEMIAYK